MNQGREPDRYMPVPISNKIRRPGYRIDHALVGIGFTNMYPAYRGQSMLEVSISDTSNELPRTPHSASAHITHTKSPAAAAQMCVA